MQREHVSISRTYLQKKDTVFTRVDLLWPQKKLQKSPSTYTQVKDFEPSSS